MRVSQVHILSLKTKAKKRSFNSLARQGWSYTPECNTRAVFTPSSREFSAGKRAPEKKADLTASTSFMSPKNADVNTISTLLPPSPPRLVSDIRRGPRETGLQDLGTVWLGRAPRNQASLKSTCILLKGQETQCPILDTATRIGANYKNVFRRVHATPAEDSTLHTHLKH